MLVQTIRISLGLMLCLMLRACPSDACIKYEDVALIRAGNISGDGDIDSVAIIVNDSIAGCGLFPTRKAAGEKTHSIRFPVNMHIQLFSEGGLWKELSFKMQKNTLLTVYKGKYDCTGLAGPVVFSGRLESAKKNNRLIDSFQTDDFCWLIEKIDDSYEHERCAELAVSGPQGTVCERW